MKKADIITYARDQGAHVVVKTHDNIEVISVFLEIIDIVKDEWNHGIFIKEINSYWEIGYSQNEKTRLLMDTEVVKILEQWCANPSDDLLEDFKE